MACVPAYAQLVLWAQVNRPAEAIAIQTATPRLGAISDLENYKLVWDAVFAGCGQDPALASIINASAEANNIPLRVAEDFVLIL